MNFLKPLGWELENALSTVFERTRDQSTKENNITLNFTMYTHHLLLLWLTL
jgi:hypothetical protein